MTPEEERKNFVTWFEKQKMGPETEVTLSNRLLKVNNKEKKSEFKWSLEGFFHSYKWLLEDLDPEQWRYYDCVNYFPPYPVHTFSSKM